MTVPKLNKTWVNVYVTEGQRKRPLSELNKEFWAAHPELGDRVKIDMKDPNVPCYLFPDRETEIKYEDILRRNDYVFSVSSEPNPNSPKKK